MPEPRTIGSTLMASPSTIFSILCPPCAAVPFANSTKPRDNAKNGMRFLKLAMFGILNFGASERDCFETPHSEQIQFEVLNLLRPVEGRLINTIPPPLSCEYSST